MAGLGGSFGGSTAGMIAFGTIAGGTGAALTGGNFWQGAVTGLVVSGLNHAMDHGKVPPNRKGVVNKIKVNINKSVVRFKQNFDKNLMVVKSLLRTHFEAAEVVGGTAEIAGILGLGMSEGTSSLMIIQGAKMSAYGTAGNVALDLIDGNNDKAIYGIIKFAAFSGTGSAIEKIPYAPAQKIIHLVHTFSDTYVTPLLEDSWNKFTKP